MHAQRGRCRAKWLGRGQRTAKTEPSVLLAQPRQSRCRQGVEGATAYLAAVALQPIDLTVQIQAGALAVWAAARLGHALRLNHSEALRLAVHLIKALSEQRPLAQGQSRYLLHQAH